MTIKKGSMREALNNIYQVLINDEELLRRLYYPPMNRDNPEPLSDELENILDMEDEKLWSIQDDRIALGEKVSDLEGKELCRIYLSLGRRRPMFGNSLHTSQEVMLSVYIHENFNDMRMESISDRISELIALERFGGTYGQLEYAKGDPRVAPRQYSRFDHLYVFNGNKK